MVSTTSATPSDDLADDDEPCEPQRDRAVDDDRADADDEQEAVGGRVEDLAELDTWSKRRAM